MMASLLERIVLTPLPRRSAASPASHRSSNNVDVASRPSRSEIRLFGLRNRRNFVVEKIQVVLGADHFRHGSIGHTQPALHGGPWHVEGARVVDRYGRL